MKCMCCILKSSNAFGETFKGVFLYLPTYGLLHILRLNQYGSYIIVVRLWKLRRWNLGLIWAVCGFESYYRDQFNDLLLRV